MTESTAKKSTSKKRQPRHSAAKSRRLNRAQQRAMEVRAAESSAKPEPVIEDDIYDHEPSARPAAARASRQSRGRSARPPAQKTIVLSKDQEFAYIRTDLRRMLLTAGSLLGLMVVLLVVLS